MKAVNLIPKELRGASAPGRTGAGVYVALGVLAAAVVLVAAWGLASRSVTTKQNEVTRVTNEASLAEQRAGELEPYKRFADVRAKRTETVTSLARSRFNWPFALREVSRVLPKDTWLNQLVGTVAPGVTVEDATGGDTAPLRSQLAVPAIEIVGCSMTQDKVAQYLAALRQVDGVTRVSLASSEKMDTQGSGGGGGGVGAADSDCRQGSARIPKFSLVVFFEKSTATASTSAAGASAPVTPAASTSTTSTTSTTTAQQGAGK